MGPAGHESVEWIAALILVIGGAIALAIAFRMRSSPSGSAAVRILAPDEPTGWPSAVETTAGSDRPSSACRGRNHVST